MSDYRIEPVASADNTSVDHKSNHADCVIRVLGVGGGGGNSLQHMINQSIAGVEFIAVNTDAQALTKSTADLKVQIGAKLTNGLGAGCDPNVGRKAAEESREEIKKILQDSDMVFITAGMGGGTGTGAAPIIAEIAKTEIVNPKSGEKPLVVAVVTKPFKFEGKRHMVNAEAGISELGKHVDSLIVIDNDKLLKNLGANISIVNAFSEANDVLLNAVKGITDSIKLPGYINLDFADVRTIMRGRGHAMIGNGVGQGANFVEDAVQKAIHSPLIEQVDIKSAAGLLVNISVNANFPISKLQEICDEIQSYADEDADCKFGMVFDEKLNEDQIAITILITGISAADVPGAESPAAVARAKASMRRNEAISNYQQQGGFFKFSQQGQAPMSQTAFRSQNVSTNRDVAPAATAVGDHRSFGLGSAVPPTDLSVEEKTPANPVELPISREMSANDSNVDLWEVPPILRNKAD